MKLFYSGFLYLEVGKVFFYSNCLENRGLVDRNYAITSYLCLKNIILDLDPFKCGVKKTKWNWWVWYLGKWNGDWMVSNELGHNSNVLVKIHGVKRE